MKTVSELTDFYYKNLYPTLQKLEKERKALRSRIVGILGIYALIALFVGSLFANSSSIDFLVFYAVGAFAFGGWLYKFLISDYKDTFKDKVMRPLIREIDRSFRYIPEHHISQTLFNRCLLFPRPDRFLGNDYVKGEIDSVPIQFSDIHAEKKHTDSKGRTHYSTIFQGLFIVSEFPKHFKGFTIVQPDTAQSLFGDLIGSFLQSHNITAKGSLVKMDSPEFEKEFVVYSNDQIEARYILTHSLMEKLLLYRKKSKHPIYVSFHGSNIYMAIEYNKDLFEPSVFHSLLDYKIAMEYLQTLHLAVGIVEELKLNQKLWSKR